MPLDARKLAIRRRRDSAFSATLDIDADDKIRELLSFDDKLYAVTLKKIFRIITPDEIDPMMESSDAPLAQSVVVESGSKNSIVARTVLQAQDAVPFIAGPAEQPLIIGVAWEVMLRLLEFDSMIASIDRDIQDIIGSIEGKTEKYIDGFSPPALPIVPNLESRFKSAVLTANHALNNISDLFPTAFKEAFRRGRYDKIISWSENTYGKDDILTVMLKADHRWINTWGEVRNAIEHPKKGFRLTVNNFRLLPNRQVQLPTWQLEHPTLDLNRPQELVRPLKLHRDNIIGFFENMLIVLIEKTTSIGFKIGYTDIDEADRDPDCPKRYAFMPLLPKNR